MQPHGAWQGPSIDISTCETAMELWSNTTANDPSRVVAPCEEHVLLEHTRGAQLWELPVPTADGDQSADGPGETHYERRGRRKRQTRRTNTIQSSRNARPPYTRERGEEGEESEAARQAAMDKPGTSVELGEICVASRPESLVELLRPYQTGCRDHIRRCGTCRRSE